MSVITRPRALARAALLARRNEDWRISHEHGWPDPATGRVERRPIGLIAALYNVSEQTVRDGIASAGRARAASSAG